MEAYRIQIAFRTLQVRVRASIHYRGDVPLRAVLERCLPLLPRRRNRLLLLQVLQRCAHSQRGSILEVQMLAPTTMPNLRQRNEYDDDITRPR